MSKDSGRLSGSREPSPSGLGPSGFDPERWMRRGGIKADWLMESVTLESAAMMANHYGARAEWGPPVACYCWTKETWISELSVDSETKVIGILFGNGRVMDMRFGKRGSTMKLYRAPAIAMEARQGTDPKGLDGEAATARAEGIAQ